MKNNWHYGLFIVKFIGILGYLGWISGCQVKYPQGKALYEGYCASCHMENGEGLRSLYPPLAQSDYLVKNRSELPCIIRHGLEKTIEVNGKTYDLPMAAIPNLSETEIHNILNYIQQAWDNNQPYFTPREIKEALKNCE